MEGMEQEIGRNQPNFPTDRVLVLAFSSATQVESLSSGHRNW
jgi:hypothetical protein